MVSVERVPGYFLHVNISSLGTLEGFQGSPSGECYVDVVLMSNE